MRVWWILLIGIGITAVFFYRTVFSFKLPVPSDTLVGLYHPWRDLYASGYPRGIPYKNFLITDPVRQQIPWRKVVVDSWKQGAVPTINAYSFGGVPLDANVQAAPFYPLNILFFLFSFPIAWTLLIMLQPLLAGLLLYGYLRHLRLSTPASVVGALAWAFGGFATAWLTWGTIMHAALWLPLMLMSVDHLAVSGKKRSHYFRWMMALTGAGVMTVLAGHIQVALYSAVLVAVYFMWKWRQPGGKGKLPWVWVAGVAVLFVSAVQWVPLAAFLAESGRLNDATVWQKAGWFLPWEHLVQFVAPDFFGNPATLNYWGEWNYGEFVGYVGVIPLVLAVSALSAAGLAGFFTFVLLASIVFMLPGFIGKLPFLLHVPVLSVMQPTRLMVLVDFALAVLAAYGLDRLLAGKADRLWRSIVVFGLAVLVLWGVVLGGAYWGADGLLLGNLAVAKRNLLVPTAFFVGMVLWMVFFPRFNAGRSKYIGLAVLCVIVAIDLFRFGWKFTPFTPVAYFFPETEIISFLRRQEKPFRVMSLDDRIMPPNVSAYYGIESIEGYDPVAPVIYENFLAASERGSADTGAPTGFNRIYTAHNIDSPLLPYLNVRYVLALTDIERPFLDEVMREGETRVYAYSRALPRVYLADTVEAVDRKEALASLFVDDVLYRGVYSGTEYIMDLPIAGDESAEITGYTAGEIRVRASVQNKRLLVVLNRFDTRWKATIDGSPVSVHPVNYLFMGLAVSPGTHDIILTYR